MIISHILNWGLTKFNEKTNENNLKQMSSIIFNVIRNHVVLHGKLMYIQALNFAHKQTSASKKPAGRRGAILTTYNGICTEYF